YRDIDFVLFIIVFFFQAEDGIRDFHVTGVQTCALPICPSPGHLMIRPQDEFVDARRNDWEALDQLLGKDRGKGLHRLDAPAISRSEERRVGKECRSGWSPDQ